ncbi:hypothetical protein NC661_02535 [Aquibacillus koreensis]|uniref:Sporulation membrane protein YtrI C-terminal domain-containing protein n=2 Tax=Aquibacillus koreensis TaxID=279446 RepID=A0A9X3WGD4_9BACI|nr:sporulation membrane protein YtrI [Aquibacillus koreensis]MCT2537173.1 hypothetical protein [Aquibacillus koreensis]MDC3419255.1 hypothetical protein [Aquibacillus koreensis]
MHIPPYYKRAGWQRFLAGAFIGAIISFAIFLYMYGQFQERWIEDNLSLRSELNTLQRNYEALEESKNKLDEQSKKEITVEEIEISIENEKQLKLDRLIVHTLEQKILDEINHVIGQSTNSLSENYQLLTAAIENKTLHEDNFSYQAVVKNLFIISQRLVINVELKLAN